MLDQAFNKSWWLLPPQLPQPSSSGTTHRYSSDLTSTIKYILLLCILPVLFHCWHSGMTTGNFLVWVVVLLHSTSVLPECADKLLEWRGQSSPINTNISKRDFYGQSYIGIRHLNIPSLLSRFERHMNEKGDEKHRRIVSMSTVPWHHSKWK